MLPKLPDALQELDKPINKTGSRGGGRTLTEEGMLFKDGFRKKHGAIGGVYLFHPSPSYIKHMIEIAGIAECDMKEEYDALPPHLINILQEKCAGLKPFNHIKCTPAAKTKLLEAYMAKGRSMDNYEDVRATWQRITQIVNDLGFQAVPDADCASGKDILIGNSQYRFSLEGWNEVGHRCCVGGRNAVKSLRRVRESKDGRRPGWDTDKLGRQVESAAIGQGVLCRSDSGLYCANLSPKQIQDLGVLSSERERRVRRWLALSDASIKGDPRICCLCRIVGDCVVQGRLLQVEAQVWAHVNCVCWSKGVYRISRGKQGLLCGVQDVVRDAARLLCAYCGCPGATVACSWQGCASSSHCHEHCHFGCAVLAGWDFYPQTRAFCATCRHLPAATAPALGATALSRGQLDQLTGRHLRVMPRATHVEAFKPIDQSWRPPTRAGVQGNAHIVARHFHSKRLPVPTPTGDANASGAIIDSNASLLEEMVKGRAPAAGHSADSFALFSAAFAVHQASAAAALVQDARDASMRSSVASVLRGLDSSSLLIRMGSLCVLRLGQIVDDQRYRSSSGVLYPNGYSSRRIHFASNKKIAPRRTVYACEILASQHGPIFRVTVEGEVFQGATASEAWAAAVGRGDRAGETAGLSVPQQQVGSGGLPHADVSTPLDGDFFFGITSRPVSRLIDALAFSRPSRSKFRTTSTRRSRMQPSAVSRKVAVAARNLRVRKMAVQRPRPDARLHLGGGGGRSSHAQDSGAETDRQMCVLCQQASLDPALTAGGLGERGRRAAFRLLSLDKDVFVHDLCALYAEGMPFQRSILTVSRSCER